MGKGSQTQTAASSSSSSSSSSCSSPPNHNRSSISTRTAAAASCSTSISKIPFRPRKIRKLSSSSSADSNKNSNQIIESATTLTTTSRSLPRSLTAPGELAAALSHLRIADPTLSRIIDTHPPPPPPPPTSEEESPFHSLARSILYQQLASKAATAIYSRFTSLCGGPHNVLPSSVLALSPHHLRRIGVSARKASYLRDLATKYSSGFLSDSSIFSMDDNALHSVLTMVNGIGPWTVHMFMIFSLRRPDVLPVGDLGVRKGVQMLYALDEIPRPSQMEQLCDKWKPYRSVGAWYMWRLVESKASSSSSSSSSSLFGIGIGMGGEEEAAAAVAESGS